MTWQDDLLDASWQSVPFFVEESDIRRGRRTAVHEYPFRDTVWVEDLGRATRAIRFRGYLLGDDVAGQATAMLKAAEAQGGGTLIHPSLGQLTASLIDFSLRQSAEEGGNKATLEFYFIESGRNAYPSASADSSDLVGQAASSAGIAMSDDFASGIGAALAQGGLALSQAVKAAQQITGTVNRLTGDARLIAGAVTGLAGPYGRYAGGARNLLSPLTGVSQALQNVTLARAAVMSAGADFTAAIGAL